MLVDLLPYKGFQVKGKSYFLLFLTETIAKSYKNSGKLWFHHYIWDSKMFYSEILASNYYDYYLSIFYD